MRKIVSSRQQVGTNDRPGESERVPLEVGDFGAGQEDILTSSRRRLVFLDLQFHDFRWVLDDFRNVRSMTRADFAEATLYNPKGTTDKPVTLISSF